MTSLYIGLSFLLCPSVLNGQTQDSRNFVESNTPPEIFLFLIDVSGSMNDPLPVTVQSELIRKSKLEEVKGRLIKLVQQLPENERLIVTIFDHERKEILDDVIGSGAEREKLLTTLDTMITSRKGSTHLWSSADAELARAKQLIEQGSSRVRLVILSDGEDMEKNPLFTHGKLIEKYSSLIQKELTIDWVTIGFDLASNVKSDFQGAGIRVVKAVDAEDLSPIRAGITVSKREVRIGDEVEFKISSSGKLVAAILDMNDGEVVQLDPKESQQRIKHRFQQPGVYHAQFTVIARDGRQESASETIQVVAPPWDVPRIMLEPAEVVLGKPVLCMAETDKSGLQFDWSMPDGTTMRGASVQWEPKKPGESLISLVATDQAGNRKTRQATLKVVKPPLPDLKIIGSEQVAYRHPIQLHVSPENKELTYKWRIHDHPEFRSDKSELRYDATEPGEHVFELEVQDQYAQSKSLKHVVKVELPGIQQPNFDLLAEGELAPGGLLQAKVLNQDENIVQYQWYVNGELMSEELELTHEIAGYGELTFELTIRDRFGQSRTTTRSIEVPLPPAPLSGFVVASKKPIEGEEIILTDSSTGVTDTIRYELIADPVGCVTESSKNGLVTRFMTHQPGTVEIVQIVEGPGGESRSSQKVEIDCRWVPVEAKFDQEMVEGVSPLEVVFLNRCSGDFEYGELDPGDGSAKLRFADLKNLKHVYQKAGKFYPIITVYSPATSKLAPKTWHGNAVRVAAPTPVWLKNLVWQLPILVGMAFSTWFGISLLSKRKEAHLARCIHGELVLTPKDNPLARVCYFCDGTQPTYSFSLPDGAMLRLSSTDGAGDEVSYNVLIDNEEGETRHSLTANQAADLDQYTLCFETATTS